MNNSKRKKLDYIGDEIILCNDPHSEMPKVFNDGEEHCYSGKFYDGIAVLKADPDDKDVPEKLIMTYPTMAVIDSSADLAYEVRDYSGLGPEEDINYFNVALKYGTPYPPNDIELPF